MQQKVNEHLEKYSNPYYFGTPESRYQDREIAEYIHASGTPADRACVAQIVKRFERVISEKPFWTHELRNRALRLWSEFATDLWVQMLSHDSTFMSVELPISQHWSTLEMIMTRRVTGLLIGVNARVGAQSSVHRFVTHPLYERQLWRLIFEF